MAETAEPVRAAGTPTGHTDDWQAGGFGVYVHWPFCAAKCPYCDFNSHVRATVDQDRWRRALLAEVRRAADAVPGRGVGSIFFGGGTPSLMPPATVAAVIDAVAAGWRLAADAEITLEANPTSVEASRFRAYRDAGVNRLSLGVQALADADLRALGRLHSAAEAIAAFEVARATFPRLSFDLIYARQGQSVSGWEAELTAALALAADHLSLYQLTIEPGTRFGDLAARGRLRGLPDDDRAAEMFALTDALCADAGLARYEVSNHARPGAEGRHNLVYWRYGDYAGVGPGAHGRLTVAGKRRSTVQARDPDAWLADAERGGAGEPTPLSRAEQAAEMAMMGLRLAEGIDLARFTRLNGAPMPGDAIATLSEDGWVARDGGRLRVTPQGMPVLNSVLAALLSDSA